ncbi:MAG: MFS transporter [Planctomycetales bacterium]
MGQQNPGTVQAYIDETPVWNDGTPVTVAPMTRMQWSIWWLATAGKFFEGMIIFMTGVALPLIMLEFDLDATEKGMVGAASLLGILVGATALGGLADYLGRKQMFVSEMVLLVIFLVLAALSGSFAWLVVFLFGIGLALGCDYPTAHMVISESIPSKFRGRLVLGAFAFQAVGALAGTVLGYLILNFGGTEKDWRLMYASAIVPAILVGIGRLFIPQSSHWLMEKRKITAAERALKRLLHRKPIYPKKIELNETTAVDTGDQTKGSKLRLLFSKKYRRATLFASLPWFFQDLGTYGIGIFTPIILVTTLGSTQGHRNLASVVHDDMLAAKGAALIDVLLIVGILLAVVLADKVGRIKLQIIGFIGCAAGLLIAAVSFHFEGPTKIVLIFAGFMLFNFMTNLGPNAMTYLLAGEVFPTHIRGLGSGFAASFGKVGAVTTAFLFPILLQDIGTETLLLILVGTSLLGAAVTWRYRIETTGVNLETIGQ